MPKKQESVFQVWGRRVDWKRRVKAVCKPCWEIRYCPYGPLVEQFPLRQEADSRSCRIFGHDCPVFHVAEPLTETKELRNISRRIPRDVQFRVLKRENQICSVCGGSVKDGDVHFDHIIPFSKGGSSDESNIRLLCDVCNQKRSNRFESEYLVRNSGEHLAMHHDLSIVGFLLTVCRFAHEYRQENGVFPEAVALSRHFHDGSVGLFEELVARFVSDLKEFFAGARPEEMTARQLKALKKRWGYDDGAVHLLKEVASEFGDDAAELVILERATLSRAGWFVKEDRFTRRKWQKI